MPLAQHQQATLCSSRTTSRRLGRSRGGVMADGMIAQYGMATAWHVHPPHSRPTVSSAPTAPMSTAPSAPERAHQREHARHNAAR